MADLNSAEAKLLRKLQSGSAAANYDAAKQHMPGNFASGLAAFGVNVGPNTRRAYETGIQGVSGQEVMSRAAARVQDGTWKRKLQQALSR